MVRLFKSHFSGRIGRGSEGRKTAHQRHRRRTPPTPAKNDAKKKRGKNTDRDAEVKGVNDNKITIIIGGKKKS